MPRDINSNRSALKIALIYLITGGIWVLFSDGAVNYLTQDPSMLTFFQTIKGWFFISVTAVLLLFLIRRDMNLLDESREKLQLSEEKFLKAFIKSPDILTISVFEDGRFLDVNEAFVSKTGYSREEAIGRTSSELKLWISDGERNLLKEFLDKKGALESMTYQLRVKSGEIRDFLVSADVMTVQDKKCIITLSRDITEQKLAERKMFEREERYRTLVETAGNAIILLSSEYRVLEWNSEAEKIYGYGRNDVIGESFLERFVGDRDKGNLKENLAKVIKGFPVKNFENPAVAKNGSERLLLWNFSRYSGNEEEPVIIAVGQDITEYKETVKLARRHEQLFHNVIELLPVGIWIADPKGKILFGNRAGRQIWGGARYVGMSEYDVYKAWFADTGERIKPEDWAMSKALSSGKTIIEEEILIECFDGSRKVVLNSAAPIWSPEGEISGAFVVNQDITERKKNDEKLYNIAKGVSATTGEEFFNSLVLYLAKALDADFAFIGELKGEKLDIIKTTAVCIDGEIGENFEYELEKTPCQNIFQKGIRSYRSGAYELFPEDIMLSEMKIEGYVGAPLLDSMGQPIGNLVVLFRKPVESIKTVESMLQIFAARASAELLRNKTERQLDEYRGSLERLVEERTLKLQDVNRLLELEIEKQKASEAEIQNQVNFLRILIDTIPNPVFIKDTDLSYIDCNKAFVEYFSMSKEAIIGKNSYYVFPKEIAEINSKNDMELLGSFGSQSIELQYTDNYGVEKCILLNKATFPRIDGAIGGIVGVLVDITEAKRLQAEIRRSLEKEKELGELKSRFISTTSHEFRTPLTSILASTDLLEMFGRTWREEKYFEHIGKIQNAVKYMTELLDDVLTVSRAETGRLTLNLSLVNLKGFLENEVLENVRMQQRPEHIIDFSYESENDLVRADEKLLKHILLNLLSNAIKYSPAGGRIRFEAKNDSGYLRFKIADEGIGITQEDLKTLFEPFHRGQNTMNIPGTGLGMSIIKKSVEIYGGQLSVESRVNEGTEFVVSLPVKE